MQRRLNCLWWYANESHQWYTTWTPRSFLFSQQKKSNPKIETVKLMNRFKIYTCSCVSTAFDVTLTRVSNLELEENVEDVRHVWYNTQKCFIKRYPTHWNHTNHEWTAMPIAFYRQSTDVSFLAPCVKLFDSVALSWVPVSFCWTAKLQNSLRMQSIKTLWTIHG
jgi:hypothetical protein